MRDFHYGGQTGNCPREIPFIPRPAGTGKGKGTVFKRASRNNGDGEYVCSRGFLGIIPQGVGKNGEGDTFCFSFGDTLGTGIMQKFGWLRGYLWKSSKIPALCGIPRVSHYLMMVTVKQSDSSNSRAGTTYKDIRTCLKDILLLF